MPIFKESDLSGYLFRAFQIQRQASKPHIGQQLCLFFGGTTSGKAVTERSAMQMTAVYSCVRILSEAVAGLPLHLYKYTDSGGKAMALDHPLYRLLHDEPNPEMSSFVFRETLMTHLLLWGNAYAQIIRNGKNEIVALYPLMPNKMSVDRDESGRLYYTYYRGSDEAISIGCASHPRSVWSVTVPSRWQARRCWYPHSRYPCS